MERRFLVCFQSLFLQLLRFLPQPSNICTGLISSQCPQQDALMKICSRSLDGAQLLPTAPQKKTVEALGLVKYIYFPKHKN